MKTKIQKISSHFLENWARYNVRKSETFTRLKKALALCNANGCKTSGNTKDRWTLTILTNCNSGLLATRTTSHIGTKRAGATSLMHHSLTRELSGFQMFSSLGHHCWLSITCDLSLQTQLPTNKLHSCRMLTCRSLAEYLTPSAKQLRFYKALR